jgi:hypothetical protein
MWGRFLKIFFIVLSVHYVGISIVGNVLLQNKKEGSKIIDITARKEEEDPKYKLKKEEIKKNEDEKKVPQKEEKEPDLKEAIGQLPVPNEAMRNEKGVNSSGSSEEIKEKPLSQHSPSVAFLPQTPSKTNLNSPATPFPAGNLPEDFVAAQEGEIKIFEMPGITVQIWATGEDIKRLGGIIGREEWEGGRNIIYCVEGCTAGREITPKYLKEIGYSTYTFYSEKEGERIFLFFPNWVVGKIMHKASQEKNGKRLQIDLSEIVP